LPCRAEALMTLGFEDALNQPGPRILAWDLHPQGLERTLSVFDLAGGGARQIAWRRYPDADVAEVTRVWRQAIDECGAGRFSVKPQWKAGLAKIAEGAQHTLGAYNRKWK
ncbi:MAG: U32 family peptidase, partial [Betaproteobacteria bacterium]|nr:U32 family peptidase [Betaproteobacteria bacterium]